MIVSVPDYQHAPLGFVVNTVVADLQAFDEDNSGGISALELLFGLAASLDCSVVNKAP